MKKLIILALLIIMYSQVQAKTVKFEDLTADSEIEYIFRLTNGDILTGSVMEIIKDEKGDAVKVKTMIGNPIIFENEISEIRLIEEYYRHSHRVFLLPTALPIGDDHFIGNFELGLFYGGIGITDCISITAGRTLLPVESRQQFSTANVKASFHAVEFEDIPGDLYLGVGGNLAFLNDDNRIIHFYGNATYIGDKSSVTAAMFYKAGSQDFSIIRFKNEYLDMTYPNGSFGMGFGLDTKFSHRNDLRFIGEIWNSDVNKPTSSLIMLGLRLAGTKFSADFGLAFFMEPYAVPFVSFVWTPM